MSRLALHMKLIVIAVLALLVGGSWIKFSNSGNKIKSLEAEIKTHYDTGDRDELVPELTEKMGGLEAQRVFNGILLVFLTAGLVGILFVVYVLPMLGDKLSESIYGSAEEVEKDALHEARVKMAQGEWDEAVAEFREVAGKEPGNMLPWVEIFKIQRQHLEDPAAALETLKEGLGSQEWPEDDKAFLMFRMVEVNEEDLNDKESAAAVLKKVMEQMPETRHSANARNKLLSWGMA